MLLLWSGFQSASHLACAGGYAGAVLIIALLLALWIDKRWGEPATAFHPVVWMGHFLKFGGGIAVRCPPAPAFLLGALAWCMGAAATGWLAWGLQAATFWQLDRLVAHPDSGQAIQVALWVLLLAWACKSMLSWRMLHDEAGAVEAALQQSLQAGRERLSTLVSRDTALLSESEVRESAIESLAENLNDSVVAPIFWFVLFGLPGAVVYRFANTADAMWGYRGTYRGQCWEWAGKWAARADDLLSWLPARLTALLLACVAGGLPLKKLGLQARQTPSPNSGWPMAAMALALGIVLRKPGVYTLNPGGRLAQAADMQTAQTCASRVLVALVALVSAGMAAVLLMTWMFPA